MLRPDRSVAAAQAFFRKALSRCLPRWPRKVTLDGLMQSHLALRLLRREDRKWKYVQVRCSQYLNNLIGAPAKVWRFQRVNCHASLCGNLVVSQLVNIKRGIHCGVDIFTLRHREIRT